MAEKCMGDREARTRTARGQFYSLRCASELSAARPRLTGSRVTHIFVRGVRGRGRGDRRRAEGGREGEREYTGGGARAAPSINSTDKPEKRATTRYVIPAGRGERACDVVAVVVVVGVERAA